jgi:plastocyanin
MKTGWRSVVVAVLAVAGVWLFAGSVPPAQAQAEIVLTVENNRFQPEEVKVKAGAPFVLVITNRDKAPEEFESHDLRIEKVIPAGKTVRVKVPALKPGVYRFVGEYHEQTAKGRIVAE